jgi:class 3 adenylate cyclase
MSDSSTDMAKGKGLPGFPPPPKLTGMTSTPLVGGVDFDNIRRMLGESSKSISDAIGSSSLGILSGRLKPLPLPKSTRELELEKEIAELKNRQQLLLTDLQSSNERAQKLEEYKLANQELLDKLEIQYVLDRVNAKGREALLAAGTLMEGFKAGEHKSTFVMSVDIRRSTELMLKAKSPSMFADFVNDLSIGLSDIIREHFGVFDKFTGDGVLAFFPPFYSGEDAGCYAVNAATQCHHFFSDLYERSRGAFRSVLLDVGLGIGIDVGDVHLLRVVDGLTVVGSPVVYACRLGGAPANKTLLNQTAFESLMGNGTALFEFRETYIEIKHEGRMLAYEVALGSKKTEPRLPEWAKAG